MKKYLLLIATFLFIYTVDATPTTGNLIVLKSENTIDFTESGTTIILSGLEADFVATDIIFYGMNVVDAKPHSKTLFSIGWTTSNYRDLIFSFMSPICATGNSEKFSFSNMKNYPYTNCPIIPAGTEINVKVVVPDNTASINIQQIYILGYYIF